MTHRRRQSSIDFHSALNAAAVSNDASSLSPIVEKFPSAGFLSTPSRKILLAFNGTEEAIHTLNYLKNKILRNGDHLFIAHILEMPADDQQTHESNLIQLKQIRDHVLDNLRAISNDILHSNLHITTTLLVINHADAKIAICRIADHHAVDLIVVGRRRRDEGGGGIPGACSTYILKQSRNPVLIVNKST
ncbi:hypothetical protein E3P92_00780 [Wallemia ichthyophaga]|uniref:UspA domain-containing protein n=2 Tax=Wallemia ichthyophaga TaxID=245174 RepID=A0A4T0JRC0_WALIC|nr:uncharacterized protein J056_003901 [Wallemia ichthyophaga EXF-994]TIA75579.1 hypothetical protein E3P91_00389 [Wallemia ichthyophaga]EOR01665.1 hypothetical protein J056_003901 [Wallemia ichthyophaga EXF-994]TIA83512.1 hypothetical protein E3P98_00761 [Wallemia ichthyophaga]TIB03013.1 hypothetical protein E3P95_00735 [Wallemia ichthyophaga]TIB03921.1 hypothetical protein E3P94_00867 [Wallemia ichthyophaga]